MLEDFGGRALDQLAGGRMEITRLLGIGIGIASALAELHRTIVHRDLNPAHVLVDPRSDQVRLIGFGIASLIASERQALEPPLLLEGSIAYISPEQTRRTNHPIDSRSDLYSLGVILYQLATGALPFHGRDLLDWVHCHIARTPVEPRLAAPGVPAAVSNIIMKLLAKEPEARYQTAAGLRADLERCLDDYTAHGDISAFPLGARDLSDRFEIPARLYGRTRERAALRAAFGRVVDHGAPAVVMITGPTGVGKTALARELHEPVVSTRALFATARCDRFDRHTPYRVLGQVCGGLVAQLWTNTGEEIAAWRSRLSEAVGLHGRLITEHVPELATLIGEQPPVVELPVAQAEVRFFQVFWRFLAAFASAERRVVLFLDDLHWADSASLRLLQYVLSDPDTRQLFVVGTYRPADVSPGDPLAGVVDQLRVHVADFEEIVLGELSVADVGQLLQETLHRSADDVGELAVLVHERTAGNPFYTREFVTALYRERLFEHDPSTASWTWDIARIRAQPATENVVDLLVGRLNELPPEQLDLIRLAAFAGGRFSSARLAALSQRGIDDVRLTLFDATRRGLLARADDGFEFAHDRIQQAAYALVPEPARPAMHRKLGWLIASLSGEAALGDVIFEVASHLTRGVSAITDDEERRRVVAIELAAGRRARAGVAYAVACEYLVAGLSLLDATSWQSCYETTYALYFELAQCRYLTGDAADAERLLSELVVRARAPADLAAVYHMKMELSWMRDELEAAVDAMLQCLRLYGVELDPHPSEASAVALYDQATAAIGERPIEELSALPQSTSAEANQLVATLSAAFPCAYWYDANLHFALSSLGVRTVLEHGLSPYAAHVFADFGMIIGARLGRYEDGYRFGRTAITLVHRPGHEKVRPRVFMVFAGMTVHWTRPLSERSYLENALTTGIELGDLLHASNTCVLLLDQMLSSARLDTTRARADEFRRFLTKAAAMPLLEVVECTSLLIESLLGTSASALAPWWRDRADARTRFGYAPCRIARLHAALQFGDDVFAADLALALAPAAEQIRGYWRLADYYFFAALALAARYPQVNEAEQRRYRELLAVADERYTRWSSLCPDNFRSRHALIRAELLAIDGDPLGAMTRYEEAIAEARRAGSASNEAMAFEYAARFYRGRRFDLFADAYLREARACYRRWGAEGKVRSLDARYPHVAATAPTESPAAVGQLDVIALATALRAISSENDRARLLSAVMRVVMQQAGADRCVLLHLSANDWTVDVEAVLVGADVVVRAMPGAPEEVARVPAFMLREVGRRSASIVLADAARELLDAGEGAYVELHQPRSALCVPVLRRGALIGALFLEHHGLRGAFAPDVVRMTELLASQVAISLESAELYSALLTENTQRRAAEAEVRASRAHLQRVLEHMVDAVIACDTTGRITLVNRACEALTGLTRSELEATHVSGIASAIQLGPREDQTFAATELPLRRALAGAPCVDIQATLVHVRSHARSHVRISSAPIVDERGELIGAVSILHDVTATTQLELLKDQFIRVAAHELKTPVTVLRMGTELLANTPASDPRLLAERIELLTRGANRIHRLVDVIVLMSTLESGKLELVIETTDLAALLSEVVAEATRTHRRTIRLRAERTLVRCDRERLAEVMRHLVDNAVKYSPGGQEVDVELKRHDGLAVVDVRDRGVGIPIDKQRHVFERFFRAHTDTPFDFGGIGLGLYLAREIAQRHGGSLWFESEEGAGSTFHLSLPLASEPPAHESSRAPA